MSCRKASLCSPGRNLKNRDMDCSSTVGCSFSKFAPARKCTDHLEAIAAGLVRPQHQSRCFDRLLDHWNLGLIQLEVDNFPRFRFPPRQFPFHFSLELIFRQDARFVHPGCTIELLPIPTGHFRQLQSFRPSHFL